MATTFERVKRILVECLAVDEGKVSADKALIDDLGADSLDMVELVMAAEEEFVIEISDDCAETWLTVDDCVKGLDRLMAQAGVAR